MWGGAGMCKRPSPPRSLCLSWPAFSIEHASILLSTFFHFALNILPFPHFVLNIFPRSHFVLNLLPFLFSTFSNCKRIHPPIDPPIDPFEGASGTDEVAWWRGTFHLP
jgi:hypothetical protein